MDVDDSTNPTPVETMQKYLAAHSELHDRRWYTLLLFNAFEETMRMYLRWRLSCSEDALPGVVNNASILFDFVMTGSPDLRKLAKTFSEARNAVAHKFHDGTYEAKLKTFATSVLERDWPDDDDKRLELLSEAVWWLSVSVALRMQDLSQRDDAPYPHLLSEIHFSPNRGEAVAVPISPTASS